MGSSTRHDSSAEALVRRNLADDSAIHSCSTPGRSPISAAELWHSYIPRTGQGVSGAIVDNLCKQVPDFVDVGEKRRKVMSESGE